MLFPPSSFLEENMNNVFTDASAYSQRMEHLEQGVVDAIRKVNDPSGLMPDEDLRMLYGQIIDLGRTDTSDATVNSRMTSLLLLSAYLRHDEATINALTLEIHKELHGKKAAATCGEAYLFLSMFLVTHILNYRTAAKRYVQQHDDAPPTLRRLYRYAKQVIVWKDKRKERLALRQKQLMDAAVDDQVFCLSHTEEMVNHLTDGKQEYRLVTIESGASMPSDYIRLTETRREEYRPCPSLDIQRLRCMGSMAVSRMDPQWIAAAFDLLKSRFQTLLSAPSAQGNALPSSDSAELMSILEAMYHVAGCDGHLLMQAMKQECDRLYDTHFSDMSLSKDQSIDDRIHEPLAYRLPFYRYMPMPGEKSFRQTAGSRQWLDTLKNWLDRLEAQNGGVWQGLTLAENFRLQRFVLQTGFHHVSLGNRRKAVAYRNRINGSIFDCYLQLVGTPVPEVDALVSCYHLFREWKYDMASNESRYEEFMRVVARRQSTLAPDSLAWLQLEEISADYKIQNTTRWPYKLICKDFGHPLSR